MEHWWRVGYGLGNTGVNKAVLASIHNLHPASLALSLSKYNTHTSQLVICTVDYRPTLSLLTVVFASPLDSGSLSPPVVLP